MAIIKLGGDSGGGGNVLSRVLNGLQEGNTQPAIIGLSSTLNEGTRSLKHLHEGKPTDAKDPGGNKQPTGIGSPTTHPNEDQTQSTRFEVSDPDQNKGKTSSKVELDSKPMKLITFGEIQALFGDPKDELKDDNDEEIYEDGEEMDKEI
ncbi:hypothetical protein Tco_1045344 [Tanacetum coccineum]|uniref:Uncharacterized protein n=1 Tax=Tanacetum coccineum TaxID=301880 RepID=A0ABQ5GTJ2_9ASTR